MLTNFTVSALALLFRALWARRLTWRQRWEAAGTVNLACVGVAVLVMSAFSARLFDGLGRLTGVWNLEDLAGHLVYLFGVLVLAQNSIDRLDMPERAAFLRRRLILPANAGAPVLVAVFLLGSPDHHVADLLATPSRGWLAVYWCAFAGAQWWILGHLLWALLILRGDPASRVVATTYCAAVVADMAALALRCLAMPIGPLPERASWWLIDAATALYALAALDGMRRLTRWWSGPAAPAPAVPN